MLQIVNEQDVHLGEADSVVLNQLTSMQCHYGIRKPEPGESVLRFLDVDGNEVITATELEFEQATMCLAAGIDLDEYNRTVESDSDSEGDASGTSANGSATVSVAVQTDMDMDMAANSDKEKQKT